MTTPRGAERSARILLVLLGAGVLIALLPFISGLVGAAVLAVAVAPLCDRLARHLPRRLAAMVTTILTLLLVLIPAAALITSLLTQAPEVARAVARSTALQWLATLQIGTLEVGALADSAVNSVFAWLSRQAMTLVGSLTLATLNIVIAAFGLYYLLITTGSAWSGVRRFVPLSSTTLDRLIDRFRSTTESMILGIILTAIAQGAVVGAAFAVTGLPNAAFWGFVTACVSILPVLGSALVWLPGTLVLAADHRYAAAVALGSIGALIASQIDNVIRPIVYRRVSQIHPMVTLVGAFAGMRMFGFAGLLLGPLSISYLLDLAKAYTIDFTGGETVDSPPPAAAASGT